MWYKKEGNELKIFVYVQPGAKSTEIVGLHDNELKIRLNAPPIEGRANKAVQKFLAELFKVPSKNVRLLTGENHRKKQFLIWGSNVNPERILEL